MYTVDLGKRIKYFRERAQMSQLDLELEIGASAGALSRIESNKVNPTKETVLKMAEVLGMNDKELDYLIGVTAVPASQDQIERAKAEVKDYMDSKVLAYLIDERWRIWQISDHFRKVLELSSQYVDESLGVATMQFLIDPQYKIQDLFASEYIEETLENNLKYYYKEVGFMHDDKTFQKVVSSIKKHKLASEIWQKINYERDIKYNFKFGRKVYFKLFKKFIIPCTYTYESLLKNSRFKVVEFIPDSKFVNLLSKLV